MGFKKAEEFYISLGLGKTPVQTVVNKILHRLKAGQSVADDPPVAPDARGRRTPSATASSDLGIEIEGVADVLVRLAKCCKPVPGDPSWATSPSAAASRSTARTARTRGR